MVLINTSVELVKGELKRVYKITQLNILFDIIRLYSTLSFQVSDVADKFHEELIQTEYWLRIG